MSERKMSNAAFRAWVGFGIGLALTVVLTVIYFSEHGAKRPADGAGDGPDGARNQAVALKPAPRFQLKDSAGKEHTLEEFKGSVVLLHFWASWCPPCIEEIPVFLQLGKQFDGRPLKLLFISLDTKWEDAFKILPQRSLGANMVSVMDLSGKLPEEYGTYQFPETYLLNANGEIVTKWVGPQNWKSPQITEQIQKALPAAHPL